MEKPGRRGKDVSSYWMTLKKREVTGTERGSTRLNYKQIWLWKKLWYFGRQTRTL